MKTKFIEDIEIDALSIAKLDSVGSGDNKITLCTADAVDGGTIHFLDTNGDPVFVSEDAVKICSNYNLWIDFVDQSNTDTEEDFLKRSLLENILIVANCNFLKNHK